MLEQNNELLFLHFFSVGYSVSLGGALLHLWPISASSATESSDMLNIHLESCRTCVIRIHLAGRLTTIQ